MGIKNNIKLSETRKRLGLMPPSRKGAKHSAETKENMSIARKGMILSAEARKNISIGLTGRPVSRITREKISIANRGENNAQWKGGVTPIRGTINSSLKYRQWRQGIFIRDNFTCQECGAIGGRLEVHHFRKPFSELLDEARYNLPLLSIYDAAMAYTPMWDSANGTTLCRNCHKNKPHKYMKGKAQYGSRE